jgi:hypothetical protein
MVESSAMSEALAIFSNKTQRFMCMTLSCLFSVVFLDPYQGIYGVCCNTLGVFLAYVHPYKHDINMCTIISCALSLKHNIETSATFIVSI